MTDAAIIIIGDEVLEGRTLDTNSGYIAGELSKKGVKTISIRVVPDRIDDIKRAVTESAGISGAVFVSGGLGPTPDDLTRFAASEVSKKKLYLDEKSLSAIKTRFKKRGISYSKINEVQAMVPEGCRIYNNKNGTAPGFSVKINKVPVYFMPGVPYELRYMFENGIMSDALCILRPQKEFTRFLRFSGIGESELAERCYKIDSRGASLGYYPDYSGILVRISSKKKENADSLKRKFISKASCNYSGSGREGLQYHLGKMLRKKGMTLSFAESCTGGMAGEIVTSVPGSSAWFLGGAVTYSDKMKENLLGVKTSTLKKYGAVSRETALEMAKGIRKKTGSNISASLTGIAGPGGGTPDKPVGLVFCAVDFAGKTAVKKYIFKGARDVIRKRSAYSALNLIMQTIKNSK